MDEYSDVKRKKIASFLTWLENYNKDIEVSNASKHQLKIKHPDWLRPFPVPFRRGVVSKVYIKSLAKLLIKSNICTEEQIRKRLG